MKRFNLVFLCLVLTSLIISACVAQPAAQPAAEPAASGDTQAAAAPASAEKPVIKLAVNPWTGSALNVAVAKIILEEKLGYTVERVDIDEFGQFPALATGDLHATLEVWPSGHAEDKKNYIDDQKVVEDGGPLGITGGIGWYVPSYVVQEHPELATWEGFKNADLAKLFATAETGDKGQFLQGDPSWVYFDADIIKNLGLELQVVQAGSEDAVKAAVDAAYSRKEPVLFYFWTPHVIHAKYEMTRVKLPDYSEECAAKATSGGVDCDYPPDVLYKAFWTGLKDAAPEAYNMLKKMSYSEKDQVSMIGEVELNSKSVDDAARAWVDANEAVWSGWLK